MPDISLIAAMAHNRVIGKDNQMPWHMPADLKHFKATTLGKPVIMGRKTFESIGRALPGRQNIVVTRDASFEALGCDIAHSLEAAVSLAGDVDEIIIMGGGQLYQAALPMANRMYLTFIDLSTEGDAHFPAWDSEEWVIVDRETHSHDDKNPYDYSFVKLERVS